MRTLVSKGMKTDARTVKNEGWHEFEEELRPLRGEE